MIKYLKGNIIFYIGVIVFLLTLLVEHLFSLETDIIGFLKGISCGIILGGIINLIEKKVKH